MYLEVFQSLGLCIQDLKPCEDTSLLSFNDSTTEPCKGVDMIISLEEEEDERSINVQFLVVHYKSIFNNILIRPFLDALDVVVP